MLFTIYLGDEDVVALVAALCCICFILNRCSIVLISDLNTVCCSVSSSFSACLLSVCMYGRYHSVVMYLVNCTIIFSYSFKN